MIELIHGGEKPLRCAADNCGQEEIRQGDAFMLDGETIYCLPCGQCLRFQRKRAAMREGTVREQEE